MRDSPPNPLLDRQIHGSPFLSHPGEERCRDNKQVVRYFIINLEKVTHVGGNAAGRRVLLHPSLSYHGFQGTGRGVL